MPAVDQEIMIQIDRGMNVGGVVKAVVYSVFNNLGTPYIHWRVNRVNKSGESTAWTGSSEVPATKSYHSSSGLELYEVTGDHIYGFFNWLGRTTPRSRPSASDLIRSFDHVMRERRDDLAFQEQYPASDTW